MQVFGRGWDLGKRLARTTISIMEYKYLPRPDNAGGLAPAEARALFKRNGYYGNTSGFCMGYVQANLVVLPEILADNFQEFCKKNSGPLPLLYRSKEGEYAAPPLAKDSDVRFDLPRYMIYNKGRLVDDVLDLGGFEQSWSDRTSFYLGCSFTFEDCLHSSGISVRNMEKGQNVSMYKSGINLKPVGPFGGNMVVSMRTILKSQLHQVFVLSAQYPTSHGAPIHIGNPARIGISDISSPTWGVPTFIKEGEVPVFWACGVSNTEAVKQAAPPLAFTHYPGSMFITDLPAQATPLATEVEIIELVKEPFFASVLESKSVELISKMEKVILEDPGQRGVAHLFQESDLLKSVLVLSHADRVAVTTGFPVHEDQEVKEETDGLPGALSICQALLALGKDVTLLCDNSAYQLYQSCIDHMTSLGALKNTVDVLSYSAASELVKSTEGGTPPWDVLLAIERAGRNKQGSHCTMSGRTIKVDPMDDIFVSLNSHPLVSTICIGDGGNELGMGKVYDKVVEHIPKGDIIACETACDYVVAAGVSNWAGFAISLGLYVVSQSPVHWRYRNHAVDADHTPDWPLDCFIPTDQQVTSLLNYMNKLGFSDGMTGKRDLSVDGLPLQKHLEKRKELVDLIVCQFKIEQVEF